MKKYFLSLTIAGLIAIGGVSIAGHQNIKVNNNNNVNKVLLVNNTSNDSTNIAAKKEENKDLNKEVNKIDKNKEKNYIPVKKEVIKNVNDSKNTDTKLVKKDDSNVEVKKDTKSVSVVNDPTGKLATKIAEKKNAEQKEKAKQAKEMHEYYETHMMSLVTQGTGWSNSNGVWTYQNSDGVNVTGWQQINGSWYYFNGSGVMQTGWQQVNGQWYYFATGGEMQTGWLEVDGSWYYLNGSGQMQTSWQEINGVWYFFNGSGIMQTGWVNYNNHRFYMIPSGGMETGWNIVCGGWHYFNGSGYMQRGWQNLNGHEYYLNNDGVMQTGWAYINENWYYFNQSGYMLTGQQTINGGNCTFNSSGALLASSNPTTGLPRTPFNVLNGTNIANIPVGNDGIQTLADNIVAGATTPTQKAKDLYVWVAEHISYNYNALNDGDQYPAIHAYDDYSGICLNYASLYAVMCRDEGIPVKIIGGIGNNQSHAWNQVKLNGSWVNVDTTFAAAEFAPNMVGIDSLSSQVKYDLITVPGYTYTTQPTASGEYTVYPNADYFGNSDFYNNHTAKYVIYEYLG